MPIEQKNFNELIEYAINAATEIFGGKYPTNMQLLALLQSLASSQVIDDDALSLEGKEFHWSLCHWFDNLATLVTNKNENDLFQNMVHDLQMAFKTKEITFDPSSYLAMGVFLLNTSPEMREVMRDFKTLAEVLLTNPKDASLEIFRLFPRTPESFGENYTGKKGKRSKYCWPQKTRQIAKTAVSDDPLEIKVKHPDIPAESDLPISPSDELKTLKGADRSAEEGKNEPVLVKKDTFVLPTTEYREKDEVELSPHPTLENKRESLSSPRKSISIETAPQLRPSSDSHPSPLELNSGKSAPKPELYDIPIDTASYYEGSFPHQNLAQEKSLCSSLIVMITKLAQNNQTSVYLGKILATCKSVIQFYKTGVIITPTPYLNSFKSNFQRLMENSAEYVSLTELAESLNFFDEKLVDYRI